MDEYGLYLRKSRADLEAELRGEGETLARHRRALTELAEKRGYHVAQVYEEIVTGDSIDARPQMQALLAAVEARKYKGVIVNDADRLARGDSIDQGIIKRAFYDTRTLIVTPIKIYDPRDPADEDFFDFNMFMARFEYKIIKRRLQTGRKRSSAEGNFLSSRVQLGYRRVKRPNRSGYTLEIVEDAAAIVRQVYSWYVRGDENGRSIGMPTIARRLNDMGLRTAMGNPFTPSSIKGMLSDPIYIGTISWDRYIHHETFVDGKRKTWREPNEHPIIVENAHPAIIDRATWEAAQRMFSEHQRFPLKAGDPIANVLGGLVRCSICGKSMQRKTAPTPCATHPDGRPDMLTCKTYQCPTTGIYLETVERIVLSELRGWLIRYDTPEPASDPDQDNKRALIAAAEKALATIDKQMQSLHDLLEQGVYTPAVFIQRRDELTSRRASAEAELAALQSAPTTADLIRAQLPQIRYVVETYDLTKSPQQKNALLRSVIDHIDYQKTRHCYRNDNPADYLTLTIYPRAVF